MTTIVKNIVKNPKSIYGFYNKRKFITIHETDNTSKGANAKAHGNLQQSGFPSSWHYSVDDKEIVQSFVHNAQCWHSGKGRDDGNLNSIAIEICVNSDSDYLKAIDNAIWLTKKIMAEENIPIGNVVQHNYWSGKNCPRRLRAGSHGITWKEFLNKLGGSVVASSTYYKQGDKGSKVKELQQNLIKLGYLVGKHGADGIFGKDTTQAVIAFQNANNLAVDGIAGKETLNKIKELLSPAIKQNLYRVTVDGKHIGSFAETNNILQAVKVNIGIYDKIKIEKV